MTAHLRIPIRFPVIDADKGKGPCWVVVEVTVHGSPVDYVTPQTTANMGKCIAEIGTALSRIRTKYNT